MHAPISESTGDVSVPMPAQAPRNVVKSERIGGLFGHEVSNRSILYPRPFQVHLRSCTAIIVGEPF